uniref:Uncharacterized protein n=1 Tax=Anguilla anguilla TaxID=7936 RepID=A0A0E9TWV4_ANGAN
MTKIKEELPLWFLLLKMAEVGALTDCSIYSSGYNCSPKYAVARRGLFY